MGTWMKIVLLYGTCLLGTGAVSVESRSSNSNNYVNERAWTGAVSTEAINKNNGNDTDETSWTDAMLSKAANNKSNNSDDVNETSWTGAVLSKPKNNKSNNSDANETFWTNWDDRRLSNVLMEVNGTSGPNQSVESSVAESAVPELSAQDYLGFVMEPIFFSTGVVGNSLTIVVMRSKKFAAMPVSLTLTSMALSDITITILHPFNRPFFIKFINFDIRSASGDIGCKVYFLFWKTAKMTSSWFVVLVSMERFVAVCFPLKVRYISTRRNTKIAILLIYFGMVSVTGSWTFSSGLKDGVVCVPDLKLKGLESITSGFLYVGTILYTGLPTFLMIIFTTAVIWNLVAQRKLRKKISANRNNMDKETFRITTMLVGITIVYVLCTNPVAVLHNISYAVGKVSYEAKNRALKTGTDVAQIVEQINYSINFFLYVLCSEQFRKRVIAILRICCYQRMGPNGTTVNEHQFSRDTPPGDINRASRSGAEAKQKVHHGAREMRKPDRAK